MKNQTGYTYTKSSPKVTDRHDRNVRIVNPDDVDLLDRLYIVRLAQIDAGVAVFADSAGDAFEYAVEYAADNAFRWLYLDMSDPADAKAIAEGYDKLKWAAKGLCCDSGDVTINEIER